MAVGDRLRQTIGQNFSDRPSDKTDCGCCTLPEWASWRRSTAPLGPGVVRWKRRVELVTKANHSNPAVSKKEEKLMRVVVSGKPASQPNDPSIWHRWYGSTTSSCTGWSRSSCWSRSRRGGWSVWRNRCQEEARPVLFTLSCDAGSVGLSWVFQTKTPMRDNPRR